MNTQAKWVSFNDRFPPDGQTIIIRIVKGYTLFAEKAKWRLSDQSFGIDVNDWGGFRTQYNKVDLTYAYWLDDGYTLENLYPYK